MAVIVDAVRTPRGKAKPTGGLAGAAPLDLLTTVIEAVVDRTAIDPSEIGDVIVGCATQTGEQGANIAKTAALLAGLGPEASGVTVNRYCASGLEAVNIAAAKVDAGFEEVVLAGGVESVSRVPMFSDDGPMWSDPAISEATGFVHMGIAADLVASLEGFDRDELDRYGAGTHQRAARAWRDGVFQPSLVLVTDENGQPRLETDEHIRPDVEVDQLRSMAPSFTELGAAGMDRFALERYPELGEIRHLHHRGNSPSLADGAGAVLVASESRARDLGLPTRGRIRAAANRSVDPVIMLTAGQEAATAAIESAGLTPSDVDRVEFAEAFAALCLRFMRDMGIGGDRFNVNGGTIAMGHAFGATGAILTATLLDELEHSDTEIGLVGISGAAGLGAATVIERT